MACKAPGGSKKKYIYYQCKDCKTSIREDALIDLLIEQITSIIEYDITVRKFFTPLLKHKVENTNELLQKEIYSLKEKLKRLKEAYLNKTIELDEFNEDKKYLDSRIKEIELKQKEEQELEQFNFTFEDLMLKRDLEFIKSINDSNYNNSFKIKWNELNIKEKQDLIMSYIESIEVIKKDDKLEIKNINFRKTFIEEYANLFNNGGLSVYQEILMNDEKIQVEVSKPMTRKDAHEYIKRLQYNYSVINYHEVPKENSTNNKFTLKYQRENILYEPMKIIPLLNKKGITKITHYGIIEIPIVHSTFIKI